VLYIFSWFFRESVGRMCDQYSRRDVRIRVVHKINGGLSDARNAALDICAGEYITFVDSDDWISPYYIKNLYKAVVKYSADLSISGFINWTEIMDYNVNATNELINEEVVMANPPLDECHKVENWSNLKLT